MTTHEQIVRNYIDGYNQFDVGKMVENFSDEIRFENIQDGVVNLSLEGLQAFKQQAELAKQYFSARKQEIASITETENKVQIDITYHATLAKDLPNGLKSGQHLSLTGRSIFEFAGGKVIKLTDISD